MKQTQPVEELLEQLWIHQNERGDGAAPADEDAVRQAREAGLVTVDDAGACRLTPAGMDGGREIVRRHRLSELMLRDVLNVDEEQCDDDACHFEHVLREGVADQICRLLGHPKTCIHGKPIPPGDCCREAAQREQREVTPLCDGRPGDRGMVAYLATRDNADVQKLMAMGILPGSDIELLRCFPSYVFQVGFSQFTVDRPLAQTLYVHWEAARPAEPVEASGRRRRRWRGGR